MEIDKEIRIESSEKYREFPGSGVAKLGDLQARTGGKMPEKQVLQRHDGDRVSTIKGESMRVLQGR